MSQNTSSTKSKTTLFIGLGIAAVLLCCLCLASVAAISQFTDILPSLTSLFGPKWASAKIIPDGTDFYMAINPNFQDMSNAQHLVEVYSEVLDTTGDSEDFDEGLKEEYNISFKEDIRPWLGREVAIIIPDLTEAMNNEEPATAIIAATRDKKASDAFLAKLREDIVNDGYIVNDNVYEGITYHIQEIESEWETPVVFGRLKDFVVLATDEDLMKEIIDTSQKNKVPLSKNENYKRLMEILPEDAVAIAYYAMEDLAVALLDNMDTGFVPPDETMNQLEAFEAFGLATTLSKEGIALDFVATFDPDALPTQLEIEASDGNILERIPAGALGFLSSQNLDAGWHRLWASLAQNPDFKQQIEDLGTSLNLTLDEELFSWTTGEYAFAVIEDSTVDEFAQLPVGVFSIFEVNDQEKAEGLMNDIVSLAQMVLFTPFETQTIEGVEVQVIEQAGLSIGYGFPPQHLVIGMGEDALKAGVSEDILPISGDETFQTVTNHLPSENNGYVYINVKNSWQFAYNSMGEYDREIFDADLRPYLEPLEAIGMAGRVTAPQDGIAQATIFFYIP